MTPRPMDDAVVPASGKSGGVQPLVGDQRPVQQNVTQASKPAEQVKAAEALLANAGLWLNGDVLACACPECGAPMTVRLWLMVADCWRCGTSIELTEEQEAAARRLLDRKAAVPAKEDSPRRPAPVIPRSDAPRPTPPSTNPSRPAPSPTPAAAPAAKTDPRRAIASKAAPQPSVAPSAATLVTRGTAKLHVPNAPPVAATKRKRGLLDRLLRELPAWLVSAIFHLLALIILSLLGITRDPPPPKALVLTTTIGPERREGGDPTIVAKHEDPEFDLPLDAPLDGKPRQVVLQAHEDAKRLRLDPAAAQRLPQVEATKRLLDSNSPRERTFAGRDPRLREEVLKHEGGTIWTEAAVARGLHWLAQHQSPDGSWSLATFDRHSNCRGRCNETGSVHSTMAGTALALLPFLGAGQSPDVDCRYRDTVARGLQWLVAEQDPVTGDLRSDADVKSSMYVHGQATIVLCEAFSLTGNEALREPCRKAIEFIASAQHPAGGWRYQLGEAGDTSVHGWQVMGLYSAQSATVPVPNHVLRLANQFLDTVASRDTPGLYGYRRGERETPAMTAEAILCRFYLGAKIDDPGIRDGIEYLITNHLPDEDERDLYYWYYGTQVMHHVGGETWDRWNRAISDRLTTSQQTTGHEAGSWDPRTKYDFAGGRIYTTALATCTLEVYYRHTPIFRKIKLD